MLVTGEALSPVGEVVVDPVISSAVDDVLRKLALVVCSIQT